MSESNIGYFLYVISAKQTVDQSENKSLEFMGNTYKIYFGPLNGCL